MTSSILPSWLFEFSMETYAVTALVAVCGLYLMREQLMSLVQPKVEVPTKPISKRPKQTRNIVEKLEQTQSQVVIFFGSQTGTAEDYANRLAKEGKQRFGLSCLVADIENYDMDVLDTFPSDRFAIFVLATYGEGEPTDNANDFYHFMVEADEIPFSNGTYTKEDKPLSNLRFSMFGLGNRTYEHFNAVAINMNKAMTDFGGRLVGEVGLGDDDCSLEDDFINWKETSWKDICADLNIDFKDSSSSINYSILKISEHNIDEFESVKVHNGELYDKSARRIGSRPTYDAKFPFTAPVKVTRELYSGDRNCIHLEVDLADSGIKYETGDHIGLWASNPEEEVQKFAKVFGLEDKLDTIISIDVLESNAKKQFPTPTTYSSLLHHYVDICSSPSRQFLGHLIPYIKNEKSKSYVSELANNTEMYHKIIENRRYTMAEVVKAIQDLENEIELSERTTIPLNLTIENLGRLMPRYYSISSSSKAHPKSVHVTASVLQFTPVDKPERLVKGLFTNFLLSAHQQLSSPTTSNNQYKFSTIENGDAIQMTMPMYIRKSNFRLPRTPETSIVMVGPGTGVAPFRGFVQERSLQAEQGANVGPTWLFFGCRRRSEDYMYAEEWDTLFSKLNNSKMVTAFSREGEQKVYVQHLLSQHREEIWDLIHNRKGSIYVCGDAKYMAKDVNQCFINMAKDLGSMEEAKAIEYIKGLRSATRYQEDVWS